MRRIAGFGIILSVLCVVFALGTRSKPVPCPAGTFVVKGATPVPARVVFTSTQVWLVGLCNEPAAANIKAQRKVTNLSAAWTSCSGVAGPVALKAKLRAPACSAMTGGIKTKKAKPRRRTVVASRLAPGDVAAVLRDVGTQARMSNENLPKLIRGAAELYNPELAALIAQGPAAVDGILDAFRQPATLADDMPLCLLAYALERIGDPRAVPVLVSWLQQNLFGPFIWATDFVTHTIKVLDGQGGLDTDSYSYLIDDKLDALMQAHAGQAAAATARARAFVPLAAPPPDKNNCAKTITVTGINAQGQQETVKLGYTSVFYDIQEQIDATVTADPGKRAQLDRLRQQYEKSDEEFYGATDYRPIGDVSVASNCGGTVTERMLNEVAAQKGLPLRLGSGNGTGGTVDGKNLSAADIIREVAKKFGSEVPVTQLDPLTVIAHERESGESAHVEIPVSVNGDSVVVYSKDNQGKPRLHTVDRGRAVNFFGPVQLRYNFRPFYDYGQTTPKFYRIDPSRIVSISVDSSACPCEWAFGGVIPVAFTQPTDATTDQRVLTVAGTVDAPDVTGGNLRVNGSVQGVTVGAGAFSGQVVLSAGDNTLRVAVDGPDGRRGCAERTIQSTTPKTTISATLTWSLADADVDLYTTQPDGETAWYSHVATAIGGRLDVDNTQGFGPENYFLSSEEGDTVLPGAYTIRVHYYSDHLKTQDTPARAVPYRVVIIVNEGTPSEKREFHEGTLTVDNSGNSSPGGSGPDWATVAEVNPANP